MIWKNSYALLSANEWSWLTLAIELDNICLSIFLNVFMNWKWFKSKLGNSTTLNFFLFCFSHLEIKFRRPFGFFLKALSISLSILTKGTRVNWIWIVHNSKWLIFCCFKVTNPCYVFKKITKRNRISCFTNGRRSR